MLKQQKITLLLLTLFSIISIAKTKAQLIIGFYNCENYYDTVNQVNVVDEDFLPDSEKKYTQEAYNFKSMHLANVLYNVGRIENANGLALMGLVEIENKIVLNHLINQPLLKKYHYKFIHFDSKDARGVDVALLYNPSHFTPYQYRPYTLTDSFHFTSYATRDILYVKGQLEKEWVHILVNHWPSRRGGEAASASKRIWASTVCKRIMDSVYANDSSARFIVMGDFNDNPSNKSMKMLKMTNPFQKMYENGLGSLAFNDSWHLFDQVLLSANWSLKGLDISARDPLSNYKSIIYKNADMIESQGRYKGYPKRTYNGSVFRGGYSDHFPVALIFTPKTNRNPQ